MNPIGMIAVAGMLIAVIGIGHLGEDARALAWGLAISVGVLVHWVNALQKQIEEIRTELNLDHGKKGSPNKTE